MELEIGGRLIRLGFEPIDVYPRLIDGAEFSEKFLGDAVEHPDSLMRS
jgi:hypothetical protein